MKGFNGFPYSAVWGIFDLTKDAKFSCHSLTGNKFLNPKSAVFKGGRGTVRKCCEVKFSAQITKAILKVLNRGFGIL